MAKKTKLTWQGTQGFPTREAARIAARAIAEKTDPERPGLRWVIRDIHKEYGRVSGDPYWVGTHYSYRTDGA